MHCLNLQTIKSLLEETLDAIPDAVLDSPITEAPIGFLDVFSAAKKVLPPPYSATEEELFSYA